VVTSTTNQVRFRIDVGILQGLESRIEGIHLHPSYSTDGPNPGIVNEPATCATPGSSAIFQNLRALASEEALFRFTEDLLWDKL
jgi:hypothetical protein